MTAQDRPSMCPVMRRLIAMVAQSSPSPGPRERGRLIDQLTELEVEALAMDAPWRTLEAIRAKRLQVRLDNLKQRPSGLREH